MFGLFGKRSVIEKAKSNLINEFGLDRAMVSFFSDEIIVHEFEQMNEKAQLSAEAQIALFYRLWILYFMVGIKRSLGDGEKIDLLQIAFVTMVLEGADGWSERARDHVVLEQLTSNLNTSTQKYLEALTSPQ